MGIHDRDYYQDSRSSFGRGGGGGFAVFAHTAVGTIILINVICWIFQITTKSPDVPWRGLVTDFMVCRPEHIFEGFPELWRLVTCLFAHSQMSVFHLVWNMAFLWWFGRELEQIYGKREFWFFYLAAGVFAAVAELALHDYHRNPAGIMGASGSVLGVVTLFTLFYPRHRILFMFVLPLEAWILCLIMIAKDILQATSGSGDGVAHLAHLAGALVGFLYWRFDLRWASFWSQIFRFRRPQKGRVGSSRRVPSSVGNTERWDSGNAWELGGREGGSRKEKKRKKKRQRDEPAQPTSDPVSERVEELLKKISDEGGMQGLSQEEIDFLHENSHRYRSR